MSYKQFIILIFFVMIMGVSGQNVYISNCQELQNMSSNLAENYHLTNNIDCSGINFNPIGNNINPFTGTLNGNSHKIYNLNINKSENYIGLFGYSLNAAIQNIGLVNANITGTHYVGGLIGFNDGGIINNSYLIGEITGEGSWVGGLIGWNDGNLSNSGSIGRIIGENYLGGLIGFNSGNILNSYSKENVTGNSWVGGFIGYNYLGSISNSYSAGNVTGDINFGGFVGANNGNCFNDSNFWDVQTSGKSISACGAGKITSQMKTKSTFTNAGWDFVNLWNIDEGINYPCLFWDSECLTIVADVLVNCVDNDGDGYNLTQMLCGQTDCMDNNFLIYPGAAEICDGKDNNCSGRIDEGCNIKKTEKHSASIITKNIVNNSSDNLTPFLIINSAGKDISNLDLLRSFSFWVVVVLIAILLLLFYYFLNICFN